MERKLFIDAEELRRLYETELNTANEIAKLYGVSPATIRYWMKQFGIAPRSKGRAAKLSHEQNSRKRIEINAELKTELLCRGCGATWIHAGNATRTNCPFCGKPKDARVRSAEAKARPDAAARKEKMINWQKDNGKERGARYRVLLRKRVFFRISGSIYPRCIRCGCDDIRLLEINHKRGNGNKEYQHGRYSNRFYHEIATGKRAVDDLEILCKPCNAIHYLEMKYGPLPIRVIWDGAESKAQD